MVNCFDAVSGGEELSLSPTVKAKGDPEADVGVPSSTPVLLESVRPGGSVPLAMDHAKGCVTPGLACSVWVEYGVPTAPFGNVFGVITGRTVSEKLLVAACCGLLLSAARTVNVT